MPVVASLAMAQRRIPQPIHNGLLNYVHLLLHFRELVREQIVCPVSHHSYLRGSKLPGYVAIVEEVSASLKESNPPDIEEIVEAAPLICKLHGERI